jgi:hypothetical protein
MYRTTKLLSRSVRVAYPPTAGSLVLRTELDWDKDVEPTSVTPEGISTFEVQAYHPFLYFKPCLFQNGTFHWAKGGNQLLIYARARCSRPRIVESKVITGEKRPYSDPKKYG